MWKCEQIVSCELMKEGCLCILILVILFGISRSHLLYLHSYHKLWNSISSPCPFWVFSPLLAQYTQDSWHWGPLIAYSYHYTPFFTELCFAWCSGKRQHVLSLMDNKLVFVFPKGYKVLLCWELFALRVWRNKFYYTWEKILFWEGSLLDKHTKVGDPWVRKQNIKGESKRRQE